MVAEAGVELRLHSLVLARASSRTARIKGVVCETKAGREAILGEVVIDATGDLDVAASAGAPFIDGAYIVTTVFRLGGVDTDAAERFEHEEPEAFAALDREAKRIIGGSWDHWWLKTPLPGVVWCNCPHMAGLDGLKVEDLTRAEFEGRKRIYRRWSTIVRANMPGFERLLRGRRRAADSACARRGCSRASTSSPRRTCMERAPLRRHGGARPRLLHALPRDAAAGASTSLLVAGRHYSATSAAQKMSREIPPCMAMGEAAGVAAALALDAGVTRARRRRRARSADASCARRAPIRATVPVRPTPRVAARQAA